MASVMDRPMEPTKAERFAESLTVRAEKVQIYIGEKTPDSNPFEVSKALLVEHEYFRTALSSKWREGNDNVLHFPEDSKEGWAVLLSYLYGREIEWSGYVEGEDSNTDPDNHRGDKNLLTLAHAYVLADKYLFPTDLKNKLIRLAMQGHEQERDFYASTYVEFFSVVPRDCPLRRILLENMVYVVELAMWRTKEDFEGILEGSDEVLEDLEECFEVFEGSHPGLWPPYEYLREDSKEMKKYFVRGPEE